MRLPADLRGWRNLQTARWLYFGEYEQVESMKRARWLPIVAVLIVSLAYSTPAAPVPAAAAATTSTDVTITGDSQWVDTKIDVIAGDKHDGRHYA